MKLICHVSVEHTESQCNAKVKRFISILFGLWWDESCHIWQQMVNAETKVWRNKNTKCKPLKTFKTMLCCWLKLTAVLLMIQVRAELHTLTIYTSDVSNCMAMAYLNVVDKKCWLHKLMVHHLAHLPGVWGMMCPDDDGKKWQNFSLLALLSCRLSMQCNTTMESSCEQWDERQKKENYSSYFLVVSTQRSECVCVSHCG